MEVETVKRDMELIRKILLEIENHSYGGWVDISFDDYEQENIIYHVMLMDEAGLIEADNLTTQEVVDWKPKRLTWEGYEFLDKIRDNSVWEKTKKTMVEKGLPFALDTVKQIASVIVEGMTKAVINSL